jgi:hypothetical protein
VSFNKIGKDVQFVVVERAQLARLQFVATELYREERINGDRMRDLGHTITSVLDQAIPYEEPQVAADVAAISSNPPPANEALRNLVRYAEELAVHGQDPAEIPGGGATGAAAANARDENRRELIRALCSARPELLEDATVALHSADPKERAIARQKCVEIINPLTRHPRTQ